ncbi:endonuclease domain-containing protein [Streptomyces sp. NPDC004647]|uniref:endonuclease domain-containing protein n=1 Tax=Streptomyces sp. NPDC004647 TaxID=3154671 RepID=UPI0033AF4CA1
MPPMRPASVAVAVPGDDGRFHIARQGRMLCASAGSKRGWEHEQDCWAGTGSVLFAWPVRPVGPGISPAAVSPGRRCPGGKYGMFHYWPPPPAKTPAVRRLRAALVAALGPDCHLCRACPGAMVDHDYATGMVRGLLCARCNRVVEECPHLDRCPRAEYMSRPPAAGLVLRYPPYLEWRPKESTRRRKIELLGFDPLEEWRPARPTPGHDMS